MNALSQPAAPVDEEKLHRALMFFNQRRLNPARPTAGWRAQLEEELQMRTLEGELVEAARARVQPMLRGVPRDADAFVAWFEALKQTGPGQGDPLFPFLARHATKDQLRWFLYQEVAGEAGFDDLVAMTQVKLPEQAKLELARNYWDEMGRGDARGMHGPMLEALAKELKLAPQLERVVGEALALGNVMIALATNRRYAYHSIGALGAIELTAPGRAVLVSQALKRLGISPRGRHYFALHSTLDVKHSEAWNAEVLRPLVAAQPEVAESIAEGALLRLSAGARCFERYRRELGLSPRQPASARRLEAQSEGGGLAAR